MWIVIISWYATYMVRAFTHSVALVLNRLEPDFCIHMCAIPLLFLLSDHAVSSFSKNTSLLINCTSMCCHGGVRDTSPVTACGCGVISALKIHVSPQTKEVLDTFGTFQTELRGEVEMKVRLSACRLVVVFV